MPSSARCCARAHTFLQLSRPAYRKFQRPNDWSNRSPWPCCYGGSTQRYSCGAWRPAVDSRERAAHKLGLITWREAICHAKRFDALCKCEQVHSACPIRAPHAAVNAERVNDAAHWIPNVRIWKRLVRQSAGAGDLDGDIGKLCERHYLWQFCPWFGRWRRIVRLNEAEMIHDDLGVGIAADQLNSLVESSGDVQVDRDREPCGLLQHAVKAGIGGVLIVPATHQQHPDADGAWCALPVRDHVCNGRIRWIDRLDQRETVWIPVAHRDRITRIVTVHSERRNEDCAIDAGGIEFRNCTLAGDLGRSSQYRVPGSARMIALVGMELRVDDRHGHSPL